MAKELSTIYIDDSAIWVLTAKGRQIQKWANMPLEPGLVKDGVILNEEVVADKVKRLWQTQGIGTSRVIAGFSGINCLYRLLTLPELPGELMPEAVRREAGRVLGVPLEELYLSWQTLPTLRGETLIYLVASPKNLVDALVATLHRAELDPYLMDLKPLALARAITELKAIIIDLQPTGFDLVVMADSIPQVARCLSLIQEASLEAKSTIIKQELDRAITFYNSSHMDKPIEASVPLLVSGELTEQQDMWKLLVGRQERPVQVLSLPMETPENFPPGQYVTNIGLALKELLASEKGAITYSQVNFNALPEIYTPKPRPMSEILFMPTIVAGIVLVALGAFFNIRASAYTKALQDELASINQRIVSQQVQAKDIIALSKQVSSLEGTAGAFTNVLRDLATGRDKTNSDVAEINRVVGKDIVRLTDDTKTVLLEGSASDEKTILGYARDLRASGRFTQVIITGIRKGEKYSFTFTLIK